MERGDSGMNEKEIYYCKDCGTLDYAHGQCPKCGSPIAKNGKTYYCTGSKNGCKFSFWGTIAGKELSDALIKDLLASWTPNNNGGGETKISKKIAGFKSSKSNKTFEAKIKFTQATADDYVKSNFIFT